MKQRMIVLFITFATLMTLGCSRKEDKVLVGRFQGEEIYAPSNAPLAMMEHVERALLDMDAFKKKEHVKYQEIVLEAKERALFHREITRKVDGVIKEYKNLIPYTYTIQHIFHTDRAVIQELMLQKERLKDFDVFSQLAKKYSMETGTKDRQGLLNEINISTQKVSSTFFYQLGQHMVGEPFILSDPFGYHIVKILKKEPHDVSKLLDNKRALRAGAMDYKQFLFFQELKEKYNVEYYSVNYTEFLQKGPETPMVKINDQIMNKQQLLDTMDSQYKENPFTQMKIQMSTAAPMVEEAVLNVLAKLEAEKLPLDDEIEKQAEEQFTQLILATWYDNLVGSISVDDIPLNKLRTLYNKEEFKDVTSTRFAYLLTPTMDNCRLLEKQIRTKKDFENYAAKWTNRVRYTPFMSNGRVYEDHKEMGPYLDTPVGTLLPIFQWKEYYVLPMTWEKQTTKEIPWDTYEKRFKETIKSIRLYEKVLAFWEETEGLEIEEEALNVFRALIDTLSRATLDRLEKVD